MIASVSGGDVWSFSSSSGIRAIDFRNCSVAQGSGHCSRWSRFSSGRLHNGHADDSCTRELHNDLRKRRSTTAFAVTYCGGDIVYRSKTQGVNALSSTEAEFIAAVMAAKTARYLQSMLTELGFPQLKPTQIFEDNESTIRIVNTRVPTERTRHIDIRFFAIQAWKEQGDIILHHIPGIINPSDDLTKPLGWVLHSCHAPRLMGHYG